MVRSIAALNQLQDKEKFEIYARFIPPELMARFDLPSDYQALMEKGLLKVLCRPGTTDVVLSLKHEVNFIDPILYVHLTDTMNGQIHVLLYIVNDPHTSRYDVDKMPDGTPTEFGIFRRNLEAEEAAMDAGLAPGQVRQGLRMLNHAVNSFERFIDYLGHDVYFNDPLSYHNAIVFERYGFQYQQGRRLMERIHTGFQEDGEYAQLLDNSTPFRKPAFAHSIRGRSWAIHDGVLGAPFTDVVMYKKLGVHAGVETFPGAAW